MHRINDQYEIVQPVQGDPSGTLYTARDLQQAGRVVYLRVMPQSDSAEVTGAMLYEEMVTLRSLSYPAIPEVYQFGLVETIDGRQSAEPALYCAYECASGVPLLEAARQCDRNRIVDWFVQVCHAVTYLHDRGLVHRHVNGEHILVQGERGEAGIKFRRLVISAEHERMLHPKWGVGTPYKSPEWYANREETARSDQFALGVLLFKLLGGDEEGAKIARPLEKAQRACAEGGPGADKRLSGLLRIVEKLTQEDPEERYEHLYEIVQAVNGVMGTAYPLVRTEFTERMVADFPIIGRSDTEQRLHRQFDRAWRAESLTRIALVTGESGIGKSRMLDELAVRAIFGRIGVYAGKSVSQSPVPFAAIIPIVKKLIARASAEQLGQYGPELVKLAADEPRLRGVQPTAALSEDKERLRLRIRLAQFVRDVLGGKPALFLIDDAHRLDAGALEWLDYVFRELADLPLCLVLAYNEHEMEEAAKIFLKRWQGLGWTEAYPLGRFTEAQSGQMVKSLLGLNRIPPQFSKRIHEESQGNPGFITHILLALRLEKKLYVNERGKWSTEFDARGDYAVLPLPVSIEDAIAKQLDSLSGAAYKALELMAVCQGELPLAVLEQLTMRAGAADALEELVSEQLLEMREGDLGGGSCGFQSNIVKSAIYNRIGAHRREELHRRLADELGRECYQASNPFQLERIHHLLQLGEHADALALIYKAVHHFMNYSMRDQALQYLRTALWLSDELGDSRERLRMQVLTGEVYSGQGNHEQALALFEAALLQAAELADHELQVDIQCQLAELHIRKNERLQAEALLNGAIELSRAMGYKKGLLEATASFSRIADYAQYGEQLARVEALLSPEDEANYPEQMAKLYKAKGIYSLTLAKHLEAEDAFRISMELSRQAGRMEDVSNTLTSLGVIQVLHYDNLEAGRNYFEQALRAALKSGSPHAVTHYSNLLEISVTVDQYAEALDYFKRAETLAIEYDFTLRILGLAISGIHLYTQLSEYQKAYKYLLQAENLLKEQGPDSYWVIPEYHERAAFFYYRMGMFEKALWHAEEGIRHSQDYHDAERTHCKGTRMLAGFQLAKRVDRDELRRGLEELRRTKHVRTFRQLLHECAKLLLLEGAAAEARPLLAESASLAPRADSERLSVELLWLEGRSEGGGIGLAKLREALSRSEAGYAEYLVWKAHTALGVIYAALGEIEQARDSYVLALDALHALTERVPEPFKAYYLQSGGRDRLPEGIRQLARRAAEDANLGEASGGTGDASLGAEGGFRELADVLNAVAGADAAAQNERDAAWIGAALVGQSGQYERNLQLLAETAGKLARADRVCFVLPGEEERRYQVIGSPPETGVQDYVLGFAKSRRGGFYVSERFGDTRGCAEVRLPPGARAVMCLPIYAGPAAAGERHDLSRGSTGREEESAGYLYLEARTPLHRFDETTLERCGWLAQIGLLSIDNYRLQIMSAIDKLTGVYTRKYFETIHSEIIAASLRRNGKYAVMFSDIDRFKSVNDSYGHKRGDEILREVGRLFREGLREGDICCRYGGEEFIFLLPDADHDQAQAMAERLRSRVEEARLLGQSTPLTVSLGVAACPGQGGQWEELKERADQALYHAKETGRNRVSVWDAAMGQTAKRVDKLAGIVAGSLVQDQRNVLVLVELLQLLNEGKSEEETLYLMLGRVMEILEAAEGFVLTTEEAGPEESPAEGRVYARKRYEEGWTGRPSFNAQLVEQVVRAKSGAYLIDWDHSEDLRFGEPVWHSVMLVPLIRRGRVKGVIQLSSPIGKKEYRYNDYNYLHKLAELFAAALGGGNHPA
ncbi:diguanylate cyclase [Paenibacillus methanolicus]|uniref:Diguanylate cyclase (GGDEF)-like protein n=1 Tax=Paenibacillus methanolicus TaxID=582686 RepID=A0A5S5BLV4_9BACL|nr:diguanylate cyclase [Paenibacillus methanolicus]TYP68055.1 diguanylate cyclase (GGDEF)-like protein [Paenibacillus methanolicus]